MGKFKKGILGGFTGKVGNIIGSKWKGITYMRSLSDHRQRDPTEKQMAQRAKFAYASKFLQPLHPILKVGYRTHSTNKSPQNAAMSDFLANVLEGDYPALHINYERFRIAKGSLVIGNNYSAVINGDQIDFTWSDSAQVITDHGDNFAILAAVCEGHFPSYSLSDFRRSDAAGTIALPSAPSGTLVYCYIAFAHPDNFMDVSNSRLVASITLP